MFEPDPPEEEDTENTAAAEEDRGEKKAKSSHVYFMSYDRRVMQQYPLWVQESLPFCATHRAAMSRCVQYQAIARCPLPVVPGPFTLLCMFLKESLGFT